MTAFARWAWLIVLGTALALSWWSLDALARHYGVPELLAGTVSATFDGAALVAADLAIRRAQAADSAAAIKLLMLAAVALSAWLNFEHGALLSYPLAVRVLFGAPPVIAGALFEIQLRTLHRTKLRDLGLIAQPLPRLGFLVWMLHPFAALRRVHQITASRLQSVPLNVVDWDAPIPKLTPMPSPALETPIPWPNGQTPARSPEPTQPQLQSSALPESPLDPNHRAASTVPTAAVAVATSLRTTRLGDADYAVRLRKLINANGGTVPSAREVARALSIGQDRARRLMGQLMAQPSSKG